MLFKVIIYDPHGNKFNFSNVKSATQDHDGRFILEFYNNVVLTLPNDWQVIIDYTKGV